MSEDRVAPRTAAEDDEDYAAHERALILHTQSPEHHYTLDKCRAALGAEAASLDSDELRKAVEALFGKDGPFIEDYSLGVRYRTANGISQDIPARERKRVLALRALLSAGDKAKAPSHE